MISRDDLTRPELLAEVKRLEEDGDRCRDSLNKTVARAEQLEAENARLLALLDERNQHE